MKRIGILGGTFDPIHKGHIQIAEVAMEQFNLSEIRFLTGGIPPHKRDRKITESTYRHEMVKLATEDIKGFVPDDFELSKTEYTYSVYILSEIKELHPDWDIHFIIGEDSLRDFHLWHKPEEIAKLCKLVVYPRENRDISDLVAKRKDEYDAHIAVIDAKCIDVSSTSVREKVRKGEDITGLVPTKIIEYIKEKGLYKNGN